jgi:hypothetical protein
VTRLKKMMLEELQLLHRARVHRTHGRPPSHGFTGRAQNSSHRSAFQPKRASGKALTFSRILAITSGLPTDSLRTSSLHFP